MTAPAISGLLHIGDPQTDVRALVEAYRAALERTGRPWELVFILDGVEGRVLQDLREIQEEGLPVQAVTLKGSFGESVSFAAGAEKAKGSYLLTLPS